MNTPLRTLLWTSFAAAALAGGIAGCRSVPVQQAKITGAAAPSTPQAPPAPTPPPAQPQTPPPAPAPKTAPPQTPPPAPATPPAPKTAPAPAPTPPPPATAPAAPPPATAPAPTPPPMAKSAKAAGVPQYTIEQFLGTVAYAGDSFSPDASKILVSSNRTGIYNAYAVPVGGGEPAALTASTTDNVFAVGYFPHDERFLYLADRGGNELDHLYVQAGKAVVDLTPGAKLKANFLDWAEDDRTFFVGTNERDPKFFDVYEYQVDGYTRKMIYKDESGLAFAAISPDRGTLAFLKSGGSAADSDIYLYEAKTGKSRNITPHEGDVINSPYTFSPDGRSFYYATNQGSEFAYLVRYDLATGQLSEVLRPNWDVTYAYFSHDGRYFVAGINNDGRTEVRLFESAGMKPIPLPALPQADINSIQFSRDGRLMAFYADSSRSPRNLYVDTLSTGQYRQLTRSLDPAIDPDALVEAKVVRFKSYDGVLVPGNLYTPHGASPESLLPAVVFVHGGPGDQSRLTYGVLTQYLVNHGYVVYAINNRGSSGYGKTFYGMDDRKHGEADLDDCVASKKMLAGLGYVDPARIAIAGGSYGGYMVLAALAFRPREFTAGVDLYGVANWPRTLLSIPAWWESFRKALYKEMGNPATDGEYLKRISPLFHADQIERPLIVLQGANDPRVLKVESDEVVAAAKKRGTPVEYLIFPDEGHGISKKANQAKAYKAILDFLDKYLKGSGTATRASR